MICTIGTQVITLEQIEVEKAILNRSNDSLLFPGRNGDFTVQEVFSELVARALMRQQAVRMGFTDVTVEAIDKRVKAFADSFGDRGAYTKFLRQFQLNDEDIEGLVPQGELFSDIRYRFRTLEMVQGFVDKKLDLPVKLAVQDEMTRQGIAAAAEGAVADDPIVVDLRRRFRDEKLREWIRDLASRATVTVTDENYRNALNQLLTRPEKTTEP